VDHLQSIALLNCTIRAYPLNNQHFWRRDGAFLRNGVDSADGTNKHEIRNHRINDFTIVSQLRIRNFGVRDHGLYECTGENDLRVAKIFYNLKRTFFFLFTVL
jgi:hypothetical protein